MEKDKDLRNHLLAPRAIFSTTKFYRLYILKELSKGKILYGKQIYDIFNNHFKEYPIPVSYSTIYDTLHNLEENNYVTSNWDCDTAVNNRTKRKYRITDEGLRYYQTVIPDFVDNLKKNKTMINKFIELISN